MKITFENPSHQRSGEPDELEVRFLPSDPDLVTPQIKEISLTNRAIGFETFVNITGDQMTPDIQKLLDDGFYPLAISSMNDINIQVIGLVCKTARRLSGVAPDDFQKEIPSVPIEFLLNIPSVPEVIDFLQFRTLNFPDFAKLLLEEHGQIFKFIRWMVTK